MNNLRCDFCNRPTENDYGKRTHKAQPFSFPIFFQGKKIPINFSEDWLACEECDRLIRNNDRVGLLKRSMELANDHISVNLIIMMFWERRM
jgi:hypothetical protein